MAMGYSIVGGITWNYKGKTGGETLFLGALEGFKRAVNDWRPFFRMVARLILEPSVERQFETEGAAGGTPWQELAPATLKRKVGAGGDVILVRTGRTLASFRLGGPDHVEVVAPLSLDWGSDARAVLAHHTGTGKGFGQPRVPTGKGTGRGEPQRPILLLTDEMSSAMAVLATVEGRRATRDAGFGGGDEFMVSEAGEFAATLGLAGA